MMLCEVRSVRSGVTLAELSVGSPHSTRERAGLFVAHVMVAVDPTVETAKEEIASGSSVGEEFSGVTERVAIRVIPDALALIWAVADPLVVNCTLKEALEEPAGTVTLDGIEIVPPEAEDARETRSPPAGAAPVNDTVHCDVPDWSMSEGVQLMEESERVRAIVMLPP
jgi:hypothetical protein